MRKTKTAWLSLLLVLGLIAAACGDDDSAEANDDGTDTTAAADDDGGSDSLSGTLEGSGASFPDAFYQAAIVAYEEATPGVTVIYNAVGSGQGKSDFADGLTAWAGTDSLVKEDEGLDPDEFLYIPTVAAPITVSYNLSGVDELQLSPDTLGAIFNGDITSWDDEAIAADNPDVELPSTAITLAVRADGSGTTSNFTKYLEKATGTWTLGSGDTIEWPSNAQAGQRNTGVAQIIQDTDGAIGYVDLADAEALGLTYAAIGNQEGEFVVPTLEGTTAALDGAEIADDLTYDPLDAAGAEAYPIAAPTYVLVRTSYEDQATADLVIDWITFLLTDAQDLAEDELYAPLPDSLRDRALAQLDQITVG